MDDGNSIAPPSNCPARKVLLDRERVSRVLLSIAAADGCCPRWEIADYLVAQALRLEHEDGCFLCQVEIASWAAQ
jgi:hypothetical protein